MSVFVTKIWQENATSRQKQPPELVPQPGLVYVQGPWSEPDAMHVTSRTLMWALVGHPQPRPPRGTWGDTCMLSTVVTNCSIGSALYNITHVKHSPGCGHLGCLLFTRDILLVCWMSFSCNVCHLSKLIWLRHIKLVQIVRKLHRLWDSSDRSTSISRLSRFEPSVHACSYHVCLAEMAHCYVFESPHRAE
jgi:hypothetical protein